MLTTLRYVMGISLVTMLALMLWGCGHMTASQGVAKTVTVGRDVMECTADNYAVGREAVLHGGADWLGLIIGVFQCIPKIVHDIESDQLAMAAIDPVEYMLSDAVTNIAPIPDARLSRGAKRRLAAAKVFGDVLNSKVQP